MDVITGEFKDLSSCFLLNVHYNGRIAILAGHKIYSLVQLSNNLTYSLTPKQSGLGDISDNTHVQDIKFNKGTKHNLIAEASDDNIILHDCTVNFNFNVQLLHTFGPRLTLTTIAEIHVMAICHKKKCMD